MIANKKKIYTAYFTGLKTLLISLIIKEIYRECLMSSVEKLHPNHTSLHVVHLLGALSLGIVIVRALTGIV